MRKKMISLLLGREKLSGSVKMDEVFFYDPYEKKVDINMLVDIASATESFIRLKKALIEASFSCNELEKGMKKCHAIHGKK
jgi:hypothetical protein